MAAATSYAELTVVPKIAVRFPLPLPLPDGFEIDRLETWPRVAGRLEYVGGRIEYMPPCGEVQQRTAADVVTELTLWARAHSGFIVGGNEAGILLGGEVRAADAAVWRRASPEPATGGFARVAPVLSVEVADADETADDFTAKVAWYLGHGVEVVWVVVPSERRVVITKRDGVVTVDSPGRMPSHPALPGLTPSVTDFFRQL